MYRSLLFVPAHEEKYYKSVYNVKPDVVIYDLEDAVPANAKNIAKEMICRNIIKVDNRSNYIRIRYDETDSYFEDISDTIKLPIEGYVLPKIGSMDDVTKVSRGITYLEKEYNLPEHSIKLICIIESPEGLLDVVNIAKNKGRVVGLGFGGEDYSTAINAERIEEVFLYPRNIIIVAAKAYKLLAFDTVYLNYKDNDGFRQELIMNKSLGFDGKFLIHPNQVALSNEIFSYSKDHINKLTKIVDEFERIKGLENKSVIVIDNVVYEEPYINRLKKIIERYS